MKFIAVNGYLCVHPRGGRLIDKVEKRETRVFDRRFQPVSFLFDRVQSRIGWKMVKMEERYPCAERAKTWFSLGSRGGESSIKERRGKLWRGRDRWSLLVACRLLPSTLDAVHSSYPSTHSSLGSAGPLALDGKHWPRRSTPRAQPVTWIATKYVLTPRTWSSPLPFLPPSFSPLRHSSPLPSYHLDSFRRYTGNILGKYMRLRKRRSKRHLRTLSSFSHGRRGWPISIFISTDISVDQVDRS